MMDNTEIASYYFNLNDINLIVDVTFREMSTNQNPDVRIEAFKLMETLLNNDTYRYDKHRYDDIKDLVYELIISEDEENPYSDEERSCISLLNAFFQVEI